MIPYSRPKLSDFYTLFKSKLAENHILYSDKYLYNSYMGVPNPRAGDNNSVYLTIIPRARVEYEMAGYNHLISNKRKWDNCFIKNNQEILLDLADFALREQTEDTTVAISCTWYNGSYTITVKPVKTLELRYTMVQFLIIRMLK